MVCRLVLTELATAIEDGRKCICERHPLPGCLALMLQKLWQPVESGFVSQQVYFRGGSIKPGDELFYALTVAFIIGIALN